jgi:hypothetical protein
MINNSGFTCELIFGSLMLSGLLNWTKSVEVKQRLLDFIMCRGLDLAFEIVAGVAASSEDELSKVSNEMVYDYLRNKALDVFFEKAGHRGLTELFLSF